MTDVVKIDFVVSVIERNRGVHDVSRYFTDVYYKGNDIISFDTDGERKMFPARDVLSISPRLHGVRNGRKISRAYTFNVENAYTATEETDYMENAAEAAEEECMYESNN